MKIYFAGNAGSLEREITWSKKIMNKLMSFWYMKEKNDSK